FFFFFSSRRRHTRSLRDWSSDVCSSDLAVAQRGALGSVSVPVPGGVAEHRIAPMQRAGCYAPGGRYPLPSSVLMTAVTARVAGEIGRASCREGVWSSVVGGGGKANTATG